MQKHPNATVATGGGVAGIIAVWLLGILGVQIAPEAGAAIAAAAASTVLFVGRNGLRGAARIIYRGKDTP